MLNVLNNLSHYIIFIHNHSDALYMFTLKIGEHMFNVHLLSGYGVGQKFRSTFNLNL